MKRICLLAIALISLCSVSFAQPPAGPANKGDIYGEKFNAKNPMTVQALANKLKAKNDLNGQVKGKVIAVCENKGCWLTMELPDKSTMRVKFKDYGFFVPTELAGKEVILNGNAKIKIVSVSEQKHFAEDANKPQSEIDAIKKPLKQINFVATGVIVNS